MGTVNIVLVVVTVDMVIIWFGNKGFKMGQSDEVRTVGRSIK